MTTDVWSYSIKPEAREAMLSFDEWGTEAPQKNLEYIFRRNYHLLQCGDPDVDGFYNKLRARLDEIKNTRASA